MAMAKALSHESNKGARQQLLLNSWNDETKEEIQYFEPLSGQHIKAKYGKELLDKIDAELGGLISKEQIFNEQQAGRLAPTGRNIKLEKQEKQADGTMARVPEVDPEQWDVVYFDLSAYPDPARARKAIIEALEKPNYTAEKRTNGTISKITITGQRGVIATGIHDDQGTGPHFHAHVHHYAINGKKFCQRATIKDSHIKPMEELGINDALKREFKDEISNGQKIEKVNLVLAGASMKGPEAAAANEDFNKQLTEQRKAMANDQQPAEAPTEGTTAEPQAYKAPVTITASQLNQEAAALLEELRSEGQKKAMEMRDIARKTAILEQAARVSLEHEKTAREVVTLRETLAERTELASTATADREAIAQVLCEVVGIEVTDEVLKKPTADLEKNAGEAYQKITTELASEKARANAAEQAHNTDLAIIHHSGYDTPAELVQVCQLQEEQQKQIDKEQQEFAKEAQLSKEECALPPAELTKALRGAWSALKTEKTNTDKRNTKLATDLGTATKELGQLQDDFRSLKGLGVESPEELAKLLKSSGIKNVNDIKILKGLADEMKVERDTYKKGADEALKALEKQEKAATKQAEELAELRNKLEAAEKAKDDAIKAGKDAQTNTVKLTKILEKEQAKTASLSSDNTTAKAMLRAAQTTNKQLMNALAKAAPAKKPAGPK